MGSSEQESRWPHLHRDLVEKIRTLLDTPTDILRFRSVCATWRFLITPNPRSRRSPILPDDGIITQSSLGFSLSKRTVFRLGSPDRTDPDGWLVKVEDLSASRKRLVSPLSRFGYKCSSLFGPSSVLDFMGLRIRELGHEYVLHYVNFKGRSGSGSGSGSEDVVSLYLEKVVVLWLNDGDGSSNCCGDGGNDFMLLTIHISGLALFKRGSKRWNIVEEMVDPYDDVIVHKGRFYAVDNTGRTVLVRFDGVLELAVCPCFGGDKKYLVESEGELLLVDVFMSSDISEGRLLLDGDGEEVSEQEVQVISERTVSFRVLTLDEEAKSWIEVKNIGDRVLFLGNDSTFSASASELSGCKGNCIFFVYNFFNPREDPCLGEDGVCIGQDIGVFELDSGCIGPVKNYPMYYKMFGPPPSWVTSALVEVQNSNHVEEQS